MLDSFGPATPQSPAQLLLSLVWLSVDPQSQSVWVCCWGWTWRVGNSLAWAGRDGGRETTPSVWSAPPVSTFPHFSCMSHVSREHLSYYANGVFVLLPDLNDVKQGLALSSWKLESAQEGRILSTTFETWILN